MVPAIHAHACAVCQPPMGRTRTATTAHNASWHTQPELILNLLCVLMSVKRGQEVYPPYSDNRKGIVMRHDEYWCNDRRSNAIYEPFSITGTNVSTDEAFCLCLCVCVYVCESVCVYICVSVCVCVSFYPHPSSLKKFRPQFSSSVSGVGKGRRG